MIGEGNCVNLLEVAVTLYKEETATTNARKVDLQKCISHIAKVEKGVLYVIYYSFVFWYSLICLNEQFQVSTETLQAQTSSRVPSSASQGYMEDRVVQGRCRGTPGWQGWLEGEGPRPTPHPPPPRPCLLSSQESKVNLKARPAKGERGAWE